MTVLIDVKLEDPLIKDKKVVPDGDQFQRVVLLGGVICGQKISMGSLRTHQRCHKLTCYIGLWQTDAFSAASDCTGRPTSDVIVEALEGDRGNIG
ncbi:hypothetical protein PPACK8108_LOCUS19165 [Phakopsora pachyrhizi]|uniref:Uncharacterized protein n=1 Tax=Phakopsora pachyrhizi TaxID=170000 RepID=A0AAV0BE21_PHAPC|nr:hypothetical protein PPACK8108_LOCUS19165 [Phakopsora pachyrhizi]